MQTYKRNQVEEAISRTLGERSKKPTAGLLARIKRLLDTDRPAKKERRPAGGKFAFLSIGTPGHGNEHQFSSYEAFALLLGLRMLASGWSQTLVVKLLRQGRRELESAYPKFRTEQTESNSNPPQAGDPALGGSYAVGVLFSGYDREAAQSAKMLVSDDPQRLLSEVRTKAGQSLSVFGIGDTAIALERNLQHTQPRKRGRS